jgi:hypothetical protein
MKKTIINGLVVLVVGVFVQQATQAQGTTYMSNLGQPSIGSEAVGSDSWLAAGFTTGNNARGYVLNSVQLAMTDASGNPSGFTAMIYSNGGAPEGVSPGSSLGTLVASADPATAGIYTYTPAANFTLSPITFYFIVLTAGTAVANGSYAWSVTGTPSNYNNRWGDEFFYQSSNGTSWGYNPNTYPQFAIIYPQFALNATPIPEPRMCGLSILSGLLFIWRHRKAKAV